MTADLIPKPGGTSAAICLEHLMRLPLITVAALSALIVAAPGLAKDKKPMDPN